MRRIVVLTLVLLCTASVADTDVVDLASADQADLERAEAHAAAARDALETLFRGIESVPEATAEGREVKSPSAQRRRQQVRNNEPSLGRLPQDYLDAAAQRAFTELRSNLMATHDVSIMQSELAAYVENHPEHREARVTLARLYILTDAAVDAVRSLAPLLSPLAAREHPDWQPWFWAGTAYLALADHDRARRMLDNAVAKNAAVADVWIQLAVLEQELDNHAGALQYLAIAEQIDSAAGALYLNRGYSLERLGRFEEALRAYQQFLISDLTNASHALRPTVMRRIADITAAVETRRS